MRTCIILLSGFFCFPLAWAQTMRKTPVTESGLIANLFIEKDADKRAAVIVLGGSRGGIAWQDKQAKSLAENGFAALALAYFAMAGLPSDLEEIPLEYFEKALRFLAKQPAVDRSRIGVCGVSKGGELVLLLGAHFPSIRAVAAIVPSAHVFQSVATGWPVTSSWSKDGQPFPFIPYLITQNFDRHNLAVMYGESLGQTQYLDASVIPVERISGPILLISGTADKIWPSTRMCEIIMERLQTNHFSHDYHHMAYPEAGHSLAWIGADPEQSNGGTDQVNLAAQKDVQAQLIQFFKKHL